MGKMLTVYIASDVYEELEKRRLALERTRSEYTEMLIRQGLEVIKKKEVLQNALDSTL